MMSASCPSPPCSRRKEDSGGERTADDDEFFVCCGCRRTCSELDAIFFGSTDDVAAAAAVASQHFAQHVPYNITHTLCARPRCANIAIHVKYPHSAWRQPSRTLAPRRRSAQQAAAQLPHNDKRCRADVWLAMMACILQCVAGSG